MSPSPAPRRCSRSFRSGAREPTSAPLPPTTPGTPTGCLPRGTSAAVADGRYVYFCPVRDHQDRYSVHGRVLRYDTQAPFHSAAAWAAYDAGHTDGLRTVGFTAVPLTGATSILIRATTGTATTRACCATMRTATLGIPPAGQHTTQSFPTPVRVWPLTDATSTSVPDTQGARLRSEQPIRLA